MLHLSEGEGYAVKSIFPLDFHWVIAFSFSNQPDSLLFARRCADPEYTMAAVWWCWLCAGKVSASGGTVKQLAVWEPLSSHDPRLTVHPAYTANDPLYSSLVDFHTLFLFVFPSLHPSMACALSGPVPVLYISAEANTVRKQLFSEVYWRICGINASIFNSTQKSVTILGIFKWNDPSLISSTKLDCLFFPWINKHC